MRRQIYLPTQVKDSIREHLSEACQAAVETYDSAAEDEDTLTGHLFSKLEVAKRSVLVQNAEIGGNWKWAFRYYKFRGRGPHPTENFLGADGILVLQLHNGTRVDAKSLLFQSKMKNASGPALLTQCIKLSTWREAAFVVEYTPSGFFAISLDDVILHRGRAESFRHSKSLPDYLGHEFLDCLVGDDELRYRARERQLVWRAQTGEVVGTQFSIPYRLTLDVYAPRYPGANRDVDRVVPTDEIHRYRMFARPEEILTVNATSSLEELREAKKRLALAYHPDKFMGLDFDCQALMNSRMQEVNQAHDLLTTGKKQT